MKKMWFNATDGVNDRREFRWVVWGDPDQCFLFDRSYSYRGHAVRRAKKMLADGVATHACVTKPQNGSFFTVHFGYELYSLLVQGAKE